MYKSKTRTIYWKLYAMMIVACALQVGVGPNRYVPPSSNPETLHVLGEHVYFSADDGIYGRELWRTDASGHAQMLRDITPGADGSTIDNLCTFNGQLYFRVESSGKLGDLWRSDGTAEGTVPVKQFAADGGLFGVSIIITPRGGPWLYFTVGQTNGSSALWLTDGTTEDTRPLLTENLSNPIMVTNYTGTEMETIHYFGARVNAQCGVWRSDGTPTGTWIVLPLNDMPGPIVALDNERFVFSGDNNRTGNELWVSSGTPNTTHFLKDIYAGPDSSEPGEFARVVGNAGRPRLFFAATTPASGRELWETDGTPEGTQLRADVIAGSGSSSPSALVGTWRWKYFVAVGNGIGKELWRYNVDDNIFELAMDIFKGISSSDPYELCATESEIYFSALDPDHGEEFWTVTSASSVPRRMADIAPGPPSSYPYYSTSLNGRVVTVATSPVYGRELWISDRSGETMVLLADINTDSSVNPSSFPDKMTAAGALLYFSANDIEHGIELWRTDGTKEGTVQVKDIFPGSASSNPDYLTALGDDLYFTAEDGIHGMEIWRSDGTEKGTSMVFDIHPDGSANPKYLTAIKGSLFFSAFDPREGEELWTLDLGGQPKILKNIRGGEASSSPQKFFVWKDILYFQADDGVHGVELWRSDGTVDGTVMVRDIVESPFENISMLSPRELHGTLYFASDLDGRGTELWALDETQSHLRLVSDILGRDTYDVARPMPAR